MKEQAKFVTESDTPASGEYSSLFQVTSGRNKPYRITINVNAKPYSWRSTLEPLFPWLGRERTFNNIREGKSTVELQKASTQLQTYTREEISVLGSVMVPVEHNGQSLTLPLIVTAGNGTPLLGQDWLSALQLDWKSIFSVGSSPSLQQVLEKHSEVFQEGLGAAGCESQALH